MLQNPSPTPPRGSVSKLNESPVAGSRRPLGDLNGSRHPSKLSFWSPRGHPSDFWHHLAANLVPKRPPTASGVDFGSHFGSKNDHFRLLFVVTFAFALTCFLVLFSVLFFVSFSVLSGRARKTPKTEIRYTFHAKTWFFKVRARAAAAPRTTTNRSKIIKQRLPKARKNIKHR